MKPGRDEAGSFAILPYEDECVGLEHIVGEAVSRSGVTGAEVPVKRNWCATKLGPSNDPNGYYWDFVADNPNGQASTNDSGCTSSPDAPWVQQDGKITDRANTYECYPHDSLMTGSSCPNGVCDKYPNLTWT